MQKIKMSKSDPSDASRINLTDTEEQIHNKIKKAKTDTKSFPANEKDMNKRPEIRNLIGIYSSLKSQKITDTINEFQEKNFSNFKEKLSEVVIENISPISREISKLKSDKGHILQVLKDGSEKAEAIASEKVKKIKEIIGF
jgi:Tryptophanyl-tRNA synthetase